MIIYIIRHGVTQWNKLLKLQGTTDIPLAQDGIDLAEQTGKALKDIPFDICYTSPLIRARKTAECVLQGRDIPIISEPRLIEICFGELEGLVFKDKDGNVLNKDIQTFFEKPEQFQRPKNGDSLQDVLDRTREFWNELITNPDLQQKTILLSSHGCAVRALLQNIYPAGTPFWNGKVPPNCGISVIEVKNQKAILLESDRVYA